MSERTVWITGAGVVSPGGPGRAALLELMLAGRSAVAPVDELGGLPAGRAPVHPNGRNGKRLDRSAALFLMAAEEAWAGAGLGDVGLALERCGVIEGSSLGPVADVLRAFEGWMGEAARQPPTPTGLVRFLTGAGGATFAHAHGIAGPVLHVSAGSVAAACAIGEAARKIAQGELDVAVAGGAECPLHEYIVGHFQAAGILASARNGEAPCRPFDAHRNGTVLGEGASVVVLEAADHARRRGARGLAALMGYGLATEAHSMTAPDPAGTGVIAAVTQALRAISPGDVDWIKAHGTGTAMNDAAECRGLATVFGPALARVPLTSLKPMLGHSLGASGAVETVAVVLALQEDLVPPTLGTECPDPALPPCRIALRGERLAARRVLLLSESFGGRCAALAVGRI